MQTKSKEKINIVTLGCAKNIVDSEVLLTQLKGNNKDAYHQSEDISPDAVSYTHLTLPTNREV